MNLTDFKPTLQTVWLQKNEAITVNTAGDVSSGLKPQKRSCHHQRWRRPDFLWGAEGLLASHSKLRILANVHLISVGIHRFDCHPTSAVRITMRQKIYSHAGLRGLTESCSSWLTLQRQVAWIVRFCQSGCPF